MSAPKPNGGPAFPIIGYPRDPGMTLRDYFAAAALPGIIMGAVMAGMGSNDANTYETCAARAYSQADAMIEEGRAK
jgi:hypothetical protein